MDGARGELFARPALADISSEATEGATCSISTRTFCMSSKILVVEDQANERQGSADLLPDSGLVQSGRLKR